VVRLRELTLDEIKKLSSRKGVRKRAVENFLMTLTVNEDSSTAYANLSMDARLYNWNSATVNAIARGIELASKPRKEK
jgi:hypothetical protein